MGNIFQLYFVFIGTQISQVPMVARQPLDLFKFFIVVRDRGGLQEVSLFNRNSPAAASYLFHALSTSCMFSRSFPRFLLASSLYSRPWD